MKKLVCILLALLMLSACGAPAAPAETTPGKVSAQLGGEEVVFQPWEEAGLPTSGDYYLTADVELTETVTVDGTLRLHLNGHTVLAQKDLVLGNMFVVPAGTAMTLYDEHYAENDDLYIPEDEEDPLPEVLGGRVASNRVFSGTTTIQSMFLVGGELTIAGGHVDASDMNLEDRANGLAVYVQPGATLNMDGGVITGGTSWSFLKPEEVLDENGEVIEIIEPEVYYGFGGAVYVDKDAVCNMNGGTIWRGSASKGGNIYVYGDETGAFGTLNFTGGTLLAGEATAWGGNACVDGKLFMSGGLMLQGRSYGHGGNLFMTGQMEVTGGTFERGAADINAIQNKRGGNIAINGINATVKISNATIIDGSASCKESHGGNLAVIGYGAVEFEVNDTVITGGRSHRGANIYIGHFNKDIPLENVDYVFNRVTMGNGQTTYRGSNLCTDTKNNDRRIVVTFNDCTANVEVATELSIAVGAGAPDVSRCDIIINGGTWNDGGFNIYRYCTLTCNGVTLNHCDPSGGGSFFADDATTGLTPTTESTAAK